MLVSPFRSVTQSLLRLGLPLALSFLSACSGDQEWSYIDLPALDSESVSLKVAYVENSRFEGLSQQQMSAILGRAAEMSEQHFGIKVTFEDPVTIPIAGFFSNLKQVVKRSRSRAIADIRYIDDAQRLSLRESIYETLENYWNDRELVTDFARPYLTTELEEDDFNRLADALVSTLETRLSFWYEYDAGDGSPVLDGGPFNEWVWWDSLGYGNVPYDIVITNQLVASAEYYGMDVHSSLRGGIAAGTTTYSETAQFDTFSWITVYQFLNDNEVLTALRDDATYTDGQIIEYSAALLTHEIGHLLLHLGHPFGNHNCIMAPTPLLLYRKWVDSLDAGQCPLNSEEQMTPGVAKIEYHTGW